jgi:hypothetical protein
MSKLQSFFDEATQPTISQNSGPNKVNRVIRKQKKNVPTDFKAEILDVFEKEELFTREAVFYILDLPANKKPFFLSDLKRRAAFFAEKGITSYKFVQPLINQLDSRNARGRLYSADIWLFRFEEMLRKAFAGKILSDAAIVVWDPKELGVMVMNLLKMVNTGLAYGLKNGNLEFGDIPVSVEIRENRITKDGEQANQLRTTKRILLNGPTFKSQLSADIAERFRKQMADSNLSIDLLQLFSSNLYLRSDANMMSALMNAVDQVLSCYETETVGFIKQIRRSKLALVTGVFTRIVGMQPTNDFDNLRSGLPKRDAEYEIKRSQEAAERSVVNDSPAKSIPKDDVFSFSTSDRDLADLGNPYDDEKSNRLSAAAAAFRKALGVDKLYLDKDGGWKVLEPTKRDAKYYEYTKGNDNMIKEISH